MDLHFELVRRSIDEISLEFECEGLINKMKMAFEGVPTLRRRHGDYLESIAACIQWRSSKLSLKKPCYV